MALKGAKSPHGQAARTAQREAEKNAATVPEQGASGASEKVETGHDNIVRAGVAWVRARPTERGPLVLLTGTYLTGAAEHLAGLPPEVPLVATGFGALAASWVVRAKTKSRRSGMAAAATTAAGAWLSVAAWVGPVGPHYVSLIGFALTGGVGYLIHRHDVETREKIRHRESRREWHGFAHQVGLGGSHLIRETKTRIGQRLEVDTRGTGRLASQLNMPQLAERIAQVYKIRKSWVRVFPAENDMPGRIVIAIYDHDPWKPVIVHPSLTVDHEIALPVPADITAGPLVVGQDPETGKPLTLTVWDDNGAHRIMIVAALGGGKTVLINNVIERITACRNAMVMGIDLGKGKELLEWRKGGAVPIAACGPDETPKALAILRMLAKAIAWRAKNNRESVFTPGEQRPSITLIVDEVDALVTHPRWGQEAKGLLQFIVSKGRSEAVGVIIVGQRGTAQWLGGANIRALLEAVVLLRLNRSAEANHAVGDVDLGLPDMKKFGNNQPGVAVICEPGNDNVRAGKTFKLSSLDDILAISSQRPPVLLEPALADHLGEPYMAATNSASLGRLDEEMEAYLPDDIKRRRQTVREVGEYFATAQVPDLNDPAYVAGRAAQDAADVEELRNAETVPDDVQRILSLLTAEGVPIRKLVTDLAPMSASTIRRRLNALAAVGVVEMTGAGAGSRWRLTGRDLGAADYDAE